MAIKNNINSINIESIHELEIISEISESLDLSASIALRINPDVYANTHRLITTGTLNNKFGIQQNQVSKAIQIIEENEYLDFKGIHFHIGSQILNLNVFKDLCFSINVIKDKIEKTGVKIQQLNVGGGLGINYNDPENNLIPDFESFFKIFRKYIKQAEKYEMHCELGRSMVGNCGNILSKVLFKKRVNGSEFLVIDASMTELIRPALYNAKHAIESLKKEEKENVYTIVGPICESSDMFGENVALPEMNRGDILVIKSAGAYAESMASNYNLRPFAKAYFSDRMN